MKTAQVLDFERHDPRLAELEKVVERTKSASIDCGRALRTIRDEKLYNHAFETFDSYCRRRFGFRRAHVDHLIAACTVVDNLHTKVRIVSTDQLTERVVRPLVALPPEEQCEVFKEALDRWAKPTGANVATVVRERKGIASPVLPPSEPAKLSDVLVLPLHKLDATGIAHKLWIELGADLCREVLAALRLEDERSRL